MKHTVLILLLILGTLGLANAQNNPRIKPEKGQPKKEQTKKEKVKKPKPSALIWNETEHDFGKIRQGKPVTAKFKVKNKTRSTLIIADIQSSCGCTTPVYPKKPIPPGKSAEIKTIFNAEVAGIFSKQVSVFY